jgi:hypothetical protein
VIPLNKKRIDWKTGVLKTEEFENAIVWGRDGSVVLLEMLTLVARKGRTRKFYYKTSGLSNFMNDNFLCPRIRFRMSLSS